MATDHPEEDKQPELVVHFIVRDLHGNDAYGYTDDTGESVVVADRAVLRSDPTARAAAFAAFLRQASARSLPTMQRA